MNPAYYLSKIAKLCNLVYLISPTPGPQEKRKWKGVYRDSRTRLAYCAIIVVYNVSERKLLVQASIRRF